METGSGSGGLVAGFFDLSSTPWSSNVFSYYTTDARPTSAELSTAAANVSAAANNVSSATAALTAAQATLGAKLAEEASAKADFHAKAEIYAALVLERRKAQTGYDTIRRRPASTDDEIAEALARLNTANAAAVAYNPTAYAALHAAQNAAMATSVARSLNGAPEILAAAQAALEYVQFYYNLLAATPTSGDPYVFHRVSALANESSYSIGLSKGAAQYQYVVSYFEVDKDELLENCPVVRVTWTEVTQYPLNQPTDGSPAIEDTVTYAQKTEDFSLAAAVQQPGGVTWVLAGTIHQLNPPGSNTVITVNGLPVLPLVTARVQCRGTERFRQGWSEYQTPEGQTQAMRYLTMTASGAGFDGRLALGDPPEFYSGGDRPDLDPRILAGSYNLPGRPLVVFETLNDMARPATTLPESLIPESEGARLLSRTERRLISPAGLQFELTDEQTPDSIAAAAAAASAVNWPLEPTPENPFPQPPPHLAFGGAVRFASADGDHVIDQSARYKLSYSANDSRRLPETTFSVGFRWQVRRRNLLTGVVTNDEHFTSKTFHGADPDNGYAVDESWTEVIAGESESIEIVPLSGTNTSPQLFYNSPSLSVASEDEAP